MLTRQENLLHRATDEPVNDLDQRLTEENWIKA